VTKVKMGVRIMDKIRIKVKITGNGIAVLR